jgi:hypothetical protein
MRHIQILLVILQLLFLKIIIAPAQKVGEVVDLEINYQLLLTRFKVYIEYFLMDEEVKLLYDEALQYGVAEQYEVAVILLEEALTILKDKGEKPEINPVLSLPTYQIKKSDDQELKFGIITGLDFNRQDFEVGFLEDDSTVVEEFSKPFVGLSAKYYNKYSGQAAIELYNSFRYDKENIRDDYRVRWQLSNFSYFQYAGYWNQAQASTTNSYWEQIFTSKLSNRLTDNWSWSIYNTFNYKTYQTDNLYTRDFYRNRLNTNVDWHTSSIGIFSLHYENEINETLGNMDNDYRQHDVRLGVRNNKFQAFDYNFFADGTVRNYAIQLDDSLIHNRYQSISLESGYEITVKKDIRMTLEDNFLFKRYDQKSALEPDYFWNYLRPGIKINILSNLELDLGYEWEIKKHTANPTDNYDVEEQNYNADGLSLLLNYFSTGGIYFSTSLSYQWRRYPQVITNEIFSLYSNRNIFSALLLAYVPVFPHFTINAFISYDNDDDIDLDQQNSQSMIFTFELEYLFF